MRRTSKFQAGSAAVELALCLLVFLTLIFGILEIGRVIYMTNILQEVTRRAARSAAIVDFTDNAALDRLRQQAIFRTSSGALTVGAPITDAHVRIDYLALVRPSNGSTSLVPVTSLPSSPGANRSTCIADPNDPRCIRFVRARICVPGDATSCDRVPYTTVISLIPFPFYLPRATTIVAAETLGL